MLAGAIMNASGISTRSIAFASSAPGFVPMIIPDAIFGGVVTATKAQRSPWWLRCASGRALLFLPQPSSRAACQNRG
jgi:hypothetical protein